LAGEQALIMFLDGAVDEAWHFRHFLREHGGYDDVTLWTDIEVFKVSCFVVDLSPIFPHIFVLELNEKKAIPATRRKAVVSRAKAIFRTYNARHAISTHAATAHANADPTAAHPVLYQPTLEELEQAQLGAEEKVATVWIPRFKADDGFRGRQGQLSAKRENSAPSARTPSGAQGVTSSTKHGSSVGGSVGGNGNGGGNGGDFGTADGSPPLDSTAYLDSMLLPSATAGCVCCSSSI
jgi:hypothetical protein